MREIIKLEEWMTPLGLNESTEFETLTEGKILNAIRWKLAKFSLRFLKESAIDEFLKAYYTDKDGKLAPKGKEWLAKSRKEKIKKMKDLADNLKDEQKQKVVNSEAAKQCERQAIKSGIFAGISAGSSLMAYAQYQGAKSAAWHAKNDADNPIKDRIEIQGSNGSFSGNTKGNMDATVDGYVRGSSTGSFKGTGDIKNADKGVSYEIDARSNYTSSGELLVPSTYNGSDSTYTAIYDAADLKDPNSRVSLFIKHYIDDNSKAYNQLKNFSNVEDLDSYYVAIGSSGSSVNDGKIEGHDSTNPDYSNIVRIIPKEKIDMSGTTKSEIYGNTHSNFNADVKGETSGTVHLGSTSGKITNSSGHSMLNIMSTVFASLASMFLGVMWGSLILTGVHTVRSGFSVHKANTLRREEIMKQLMSSKRNLKEDFEFASIGALLNEFYY